MDPIGFALENFDGTGHWRTNDDGAKIDASGTLFNGAKIDGVIGLRKALSAQPEIFVGVMTEKMLTYALGRGIEYYDMPAVRKIVQDSRSKDFRFSSVVVGIVPSLSPGARGVARPRTPSCSCLRITSFVRITGFAGAARGAVA